MARLFGGLVENLKIEQSFIFIYGLIVPKKNPGVFNFCNIGMIVAIFYHKRSTNILQTNILSIH